MNDQINKDMGRQWQRDKWCNVNKTKLLSFQMLFDWTDNIYRSPPPVNTAVTQGFQAKQGFAL